eukprot:3020748-Pyramimonas_sp.AAC.1
MSAAVIPKYEERLESFPAGPAPHISIEDCSLAGEDKNRVTTYFRSDTRRRAVPSGTTPAEL